METPASTSPPSFPPLGLVHRIWGVLVSPRVVFENLRDHPRFLGVLLVLVIVHVLAGILVTDVAIQSQQLKATAAGTEGGPTPEQMARIFRVLIPAVSAFGPLFYTFLLAAVFLFVSNVLLGGQATYRRLLAGMAHVGVVTLPMMLVRLPLVLAQGDLNVQTSLAAFLPSSDSGTYLYQLLTQFEIFTIWMVFLSAIAVSVLGGIPWAKARIGVLATWGLWILVWPPIATIVQRLGGG